jgi:hypothetical protein
LTIYINPESTDARYVLTNPQGAWRHSDAVQFIGTRRYGNAWSAQLSYTWGRTVGSFDDENGSDAANTDVGTNGNSQPTTWSPRSSIRTRAPPSARSAGTQHRGGSGSDFL